MSTIWRAPQAGSAHEGRAVPGTREPREKPRWQVRHRLSRDGRYDSADCNVRSLVFAFVRLCHVYADQARNPEDM